MKKKLTALLLALVIAIALPTTLVGCSSEEQEGVIRLNEVAHTIFYAPMYIAMENGYFDDYDITIELTNGSGADNVMTALTTGAADIGLMGPESTIYLNIGGSSTHPVVFGQLTQCDGSFLVAREADDDFTFSDMEGKHVIAGRVGGVPAMTLEYLINQAGVETDELTFDTSVEFANMAAAFIGDDKYDYVSLFEPTASTLVQEGQGYIVASLGESSGEVPYTAFSANSAYLEENEEQCENFLRAITKGYDYIMDNLDDLDGIADILSAQFDGTDHDLIVSSLQSYIDIDAWCDNPIVSETAFDNLQDIMENAGQLDVRADFDDIVDNTIAKRI